MGTVKVAGDPLSAEEQVILKANLEKMQCIPIFLDDQTHNDTYKVTLTLILTLILILTLTLILTLNRKNPNP